MRNTHHRNNGVAEVVSLERCRAGFSPLMPIHGVSTPRRSFSYNKLPQKPLNLSVLKLDGSSFDVKVTKTATVAELKQAVEDVFSNAPKEGPGKISWLHLWGHFCLCHDGEKLISENERIRNFGIKDGDQLYFIRHLSTNYNLIKKRSKKQVFALKRCRGSKSKSKGYKEKEYPDHDEDEEDEEEEDGDDEENIKHGKYDDNDGDVIKCRKFKFARILKRWFSH